MRKIFLDFGAYNGDSVDTFYHQTADWEEYEIHCFEPNPEFRSYFEEMDVEYHPNAVWIEDKKMSFYIAQKAVGSTLLGDKTSGDVNYQAPIEVDAIDIDAWIKRNIREDDYVICKMDIEGAEFEVIPHMMKGGSFNYLAEIWVEFHANKVPAYTTTDKIKLIQSIKETDVIYRDWH